MLMMLSLATIATACRADAPNLDDAITGFIQTDFRGSYRAQADQGLEVSFTWVHSGDASRWDLTAHHDGRVLSQTWIVDGTRETVCASLDGSDPSASITGRCVAESMASHSSAFLGLDGFAVQDANVEERFSRDIVDTSATCWELSGDPASNIDPWMQCHSDDGSLLFADGALAQVLLQGFQLKLEGAGFEPELVLDTSLIRSFEAVEFEPGAAGVNVEAPLPVIDN
jgi:hypothetical protein